MSLSGALFLILCSSLSMSEDLPFAEGFEMCLLASEVDLGAWEGFLSVAGLAMLPKIEPRMSPEGSGFFSAAGWLEEPKS